MKTGKTPYEIRSDILHLAHRIVQDRKNADGALKAEQATSEIIYVTSAPTTEEVIAEAEKLNGFVSQTTDK